MAQLAGAKSKQEKDRILVVMREKSRLMEEESTSSTTTPIPGTPAEPASAVNGHHQYFDRQHWNHIQTFAPTMRWPENRHDAGVFVISDDESNEDEDDEDEDEDEEDEEEPELMVVV